MRIERAIISVSDKSGVVELAKALKEHRVEILSTGGTARHLQSAGIAVTAISEWSGAPEILGGRVKTLTPKVFGSILMDRTNSDHVADCARLSIPRVDVVVVNLYPFQSTVAKPNVTLADAVEQIDVGGPAMLRAAAKNHRHVLPLCDPSLYDAFIRELEGAEISDAFRLRCAIAVYEKTSAYDAAIASWLRREASETYEEATERASTPDLLNVSLTKFQDLRYGENPQQSASFYVASQSKPFEQIQGKELSYNNLLDLDAAIRLANAFHEPAIAVIKHTNPCGVARRETLVDALGAALQSDPVSAFGGIIGANRELDAACARAVGDIFLEVIVAPSFSEEALQLLTKKKNLRLVITEAKVPELELRSAAGGVLAQTADRVAGRDMWKFVTEKIPTDDEIDGLEFAWIVSAFVKSNAIVLTNQTQSVGIGAGQMSRVDAGRVAIMKAVLPVSGTFAASDAFFPFRDGLDLLADAGIRAIIQPGGSVRDEEVIAAANERGVAMVFTGERHFRH
ncbi:MAG TPA: bifunctional phosphoribosylaminoimidazolecarboxamide formyltransferase/IMP cyclohydrolase [Thermoanaerobaculia bacterium]|nr:bifunctional phosphoribosylaminoimidazolecarboxamide formyltransferase/IMP cyclohydrolase [Thermoanaerobaculia bacterium]